MKIFRNTFLRATACILMLLASQITCAYDFEVDGLYYKITSEENLEVSITYKMLGETTETYTGNLKIPTSVTNSNKTYSVTAIYSNAFENCSGLNSLNIPNTITSIGVMAFKGCHGLTSITLPNSITSIESGGFYDCDGLVSISLPNSITSIGSSAFYDCDRLTTVTLPGSITSIESYAFYECDNLELVISGIDTPFAIDENVFSKSYIYPIAILKVPDGTKDVYKQTQSWSNNFRYIIEDDENLYRLTLNVNGNGRGTIDSNKYVRDGTDSKLFPEGTDNTLMFYPDKDCHIKYVKVNDVDMTSELDSSYGNPLNIHVSSDITVDAEFVETKSYNLSVSVSDYGNVQILSTGRSSVSGFFGNSTKKYTVKEGTQITLYFTPNNGYQLNSIKINDVDVTSDVIDNKYIIEDITEDTSIEIVFGIKTYELSIKSTGEGTVSYGDISVKKDSSIVLIEYGNSVTITLTPDEGNRIRKMLVDGSDLTNLIKDNQYTLGNIYSNKSVVVEFESIPNTTYTLSIKASGNGTVNYDNTSIKNTTSTFNVNKGTSATITLIPDNGYRVKSLTVNSTDVTSSISNNQFIISSINANTNVIAEFEAVPISTYTLTIKATGNGTAIYGDTSVKDGFAEITLNAGVSATIQFRPDEGNKIKRVVVDDIDITSTISNNQYVISSLSSNTTVDVEFEEAKGSIYTLTIKASGNGAAVYGDNSIKNTTATYSLEEGSSATISFVPDEGNKIKSVKVITGATETSTTWKEYTISSISTNITIEVEFEEINTSTFTLSIKATGNGSAKYGDNTIRNNTSEFNLNKGDSAIVTFSADDGYYIKKTTITIDGTTTSTSVPRKEYSINGINANTAIEVEFAPVNPDEYILTITATGKGNANYGEESIRNNSAEFTLKKGASATIKFSPDEGYKVKIVNIKKDGSTLSFVKNEYTIDEITCNTTVEVEFWEILEAISDDNINYTVVSQDQRTVTVASGDYDLVLDVPATFRAYDREWKVVGIDENALKDATQLAAIIWKPNTAFTEKVTNPNLLLYVKSTDYAPTEIKNVIVNSKAKSITLTDAASGNNFYCPQEFIAEQITYEHNYSMKTGYSTCQGWETIVLPFDVAVVNNNIGTELVPYIQWNLGDSKRPFWLCSMNEEGWNDESAIKANTPYIISMPNNDNYDATYNISGNIVFSASNATVKTSDNLASSKRGHRSLVPNYQNRDSSPDIYALNVNNLWSSNTESDLVEGSAFVRDSRQSRPFEAFMTIDSGSAATRSISIFGDDDTTGILSLPLADNHNDGTIRVYSLSGILLKQGTNKKILDELPKGIYVMNGKKIIK